jgi:hypothetical protein
MVQLLLTVVVCQSINKVISYRTVGFPFTDITLYATTGYMVGTPEFIAETAVRNYICDLYLQKMNGYKPPKTSRISIQPDYHGRWERPWKYGSIANTSPYFNYDEYVAMDKTSKYRYLLEIIQQSTLLLCDEYNWDKSIFENAYRQVQSAHFKFRIDCPAKQSRDRKKSGMLVIEKSEMITSVWININVEGQMIVKKLFDKQNSWCYDCVYLLARYNKWLDVDRFGIAFQKGRIEAWYSLSEDKVALIEHGIQVDKIDFRRHFFMQLSDR